MFLTKLRVEPIRGTTKRRVLSDLAYQDLVYGRIEVPHGFITDYASIPSVVPRWFIDQDAAFIRDASVLHDYLYSKNCPYTKILNREQVDRIFYRAMLSLCRNPWDAFRARIAYLAVRFFGFNHFRKEG